MPWQTPPMQTAGDTQSPLPLHDDLHASPLQTNAPQLCVVGAGHAPWPSQVAASVSTPAAQLWVRQVAAVLG
jgi:hypothetical protein